MKLPEPSFSVGIEEEYLLVDRRSRDLVTDMPPTMLEDCEKLAEEQPVSRELLRSQIEVGTRVCHSLAEARAALKCLRRAVVQVAEGHGAHRRDAGRGATAAHLRHACARRH